VVADDALLTRQGVVHVLADAGLEVVAEVGDPESLLEAVERHRPDVAVVDIRMPPTFSNEGLLAARRIRDGHPDVGVLLLSQYLEPTYALELVESRVEQVGYLLKERVFSAATLVEAVLRIHQGETVVDPTIVSTLFGRRRREDPLGRLSPREREVLELVAEGLSNLSIAERLGVTERTVEAHVTQIFLKLDLTEVQGSHRRVLAVLAFLRT
jgi:DNA-binding NarL/FixJ family response regulator